VRCFVHAECYTAVPVDQAADEAHSAYYRQFPFGNGLHLRCMHHFYTQLCKPIACNYGFLKLKSIAIHPISYDVNMPSK